MRCQNFLHSFVVIMLTITLYGLLGCGDTKDPMPVTPSENQAAEGASMQTDAQGYFVKYVDNNRAGAYTVLVEYSGLSAMSKRFELDVGERRDDLVLTLPGDPQ